MTYHFVFDRKKLITLFVILALVGFTLFLAGLMIGRGLESSNFGSAPGVESGAGPSPEPEPGLAEPPASGTLAKLTDSARSRTDGEKGDATPDRNPPRPSKAKPTRASGSSPLASGDSPPAGPEPPAATKSPAGEGRVYELQLSQVGSALEADREVERWRAAGLAPYVVAARPAAGAPRFTVRIGPFGSHERALEMQRQLSRDQGHQGILRWRRLPAAPATEQPAPSSGPGS